MKGFSLCVIGSSHTAAIWQAWKNRTPATLGDFSVTFFASWVSSMRDLVYRDGALVPENEQLAEMLAITSGGLDRIEIGRYDAFVVVGMGFRFSLARLCNELGLVEHLDWGPVKRLLSQACYEAMIRCSFERSPALSLADSIRSAADRPVLICPQPFPLETTLDEPPLRDDPRLRDPRFLDSIISRIKAVALALAAEHGSEILWQDHSTVGLPGFTKAEFGLGALNLSVLRNESRDVGGNHMNEEYGFRTLMAVLRRLDELSGGRVLAENGGSAQPAALRRTA